MQIEVVLLPEHLTRLNLSPRIVVVFDVLRATTSVAAALAAGVKEIQIFPSVDVARAAAAAAGPGRLLCGEHKCLPPDGFDLGNSPGAFLPAHAGRTMLLATTNGTKALIAAEPAHAVLTGALVNAAAVAQVAAAFQRDIIMLCAGTQGEVAMEDILGAGAVTAELSRINQVTLASDTALLSLRLFQASAGGLATALSETRGGQNVIAAGLGQDIAFAARLNAIDAVGILRRDPLRVVPFDRKGATFPRACP